MTDGETIWQRATVTTSLARASDGSTAVTIARRLGRVIVRSAREGARDLGVAYRTSALGALERWVGRTSRASYTGRWLIGERSSPKVVDLESTWTVGPALALGDWLAGRRVVHQSTRVLRRTTRPIRRAPVRLAGVAAIGFAVASIALSWSAAGVAVQVSWIVLATLGLLGLRIDASWRELAAGSVGTVLRRIFEPPVLDDRASGDE